MDWIALMEFFEWKLIDFRIFRSLFYSLSILPSFFLSLHQLNILRCDALPCTPHQSKSLKAQIFRIFSNENFFEMYSSFVLFVFIACFSVRMKWFSCCSKFHELGSIDVHCSFHIFGFAKLHWFGWNTFGFWIRSNRICGIWVNHYSVVEY